MIGFIELHGVGSGDRMFVNINSIVGIVEAGDRDYTAVQMLNGHMAVRESYEDIKAAIRRTRGDER